ncbi:MAG: methyltransferase domain-containing protein [Luteitalea sp.]|nr:methyltransferase domain-containing protein [Luteitalea sp.]
MYSPSGRWVWVWALGTVPRRPRHRGGCGRRLCRTGVRAAQSWASCAGFNARFLVGSAMALPFRGRPFDGVLAALVLDNLSRADCAQAVRALSTVVRAGTRGFFVFNPVLTPAELAAIPEDNPTKGCMHVVYEEHELATCLTGWSVMRYGSSAERFRLIEATFPG